ncbi:hypothetical protein [Rugosimonospora africana]|uniref:Uncharacterized protein n=1 Tax=Rugosimonospora africana TaxID=556532 RepID=A0A8J3VRN0_9ACTN|nr:hypothetical protein [Rugosimonospora africana]GIH16317.1 hypothetical protein Raf01_44890 [Rugosimonospora africana]
MAFAIAMIILGLLLTRLARPRASRADRPAPWALLPSASTPFPYVNRLPSIAELRGMAASRES